MSSLHWLSAKDIQQKVASGQTSAVEVTRYFLDRIAHVDSRMHAFLYVDAEGAMAQAAAVDKAREQGRPLGALAGVPIAIKDNLCTRGVPTTCASRILEGYVPPYDADCVTRLLNEGAVLVGKTNMDEFAMGSSNENSAFARVHNPWDLERAPGGSSGGSAAGVAGGLATGALGSDTGGSVRQPGAFCGITAIKPTYGRVSRYGLIAFASSLDQVGPMARTVADAARLLRVIAGHDQRDATCVSREVEDYEGECGREVRGLRVGIEREILQGADEEVVKAFEASVKRLERAGCQIVDVRLPHSKHAVSVYYLVATAEASSNLARFDGVRYGLRVAGSDATDMYGKTRAAGFGAEVKRRIMLGTYALSAGYYEAYYLKAQKVRTLIRRDFDLAFQACDVVFTPTSPTPAFRLGEKTSDPLSMYLADIYTLPPSLAGLPSISTPCGFSSSGLPLGGQFTAPPFKESLLVRIADALERETDIVGKHPAAFS